MKIPVESTVLATLVLASVTIQLFLFAGTAHSMSAAVPRASLHMQARALRRERAMTRHQQSPEPQTASGQEMARAYLQSMHRALRLQQP
ncbi:MAG TPA: hypothetical protein VMT50_01480 [Steroidobacteraceae bacterium]|nr:hypothetical protein [Steroidobacteraceae bacterium]